MTVRPRFLLFLSAVFFFSGCSTTKDKWLNIKYHETTARFNAFFNGEEAFNEAVVQFEKTEELDFENLLPIYYWPDEKQATALFAKMDRALEKSAIVIKKHSMVFRGEQRNDYVVKAYLLIAKARFYKHELIQCIEATSYMADQFGGVEKAQDELFWAKLLAAQTHIRMGNGFQAEYLLDEIYTVKLPKDQLFEAQKTYAAYFISTGKYTEAQKWVALAAAGAPNKSQKVRLTYLNAQLLAKNGQGYESALAYEEVLKLHPDNYDITFSAQIKRAENFDVFMEDVAVIEKDLEKMLRDDKNLTYRDQIYYVWALKQLDLEHYPEAEGLLGKSIRYSVNNPKQKGKSYLKLAGISFDFKEFVPAQAYYDSAITALPAGYGGLDTLVERKSVLDELVAAINTIALEDSLQALYGMSEQDLRAKFESYIEKKKEQEAAAARAAELSALRAKCVAGGCGTSSGRRLGRMVFL
jgi:tetratricopeptide (TPR) repeat protein